MAWNPYAAGNKVYRSGDHAPTRGTVDPSGYVERSLKQRMLKNGQSQTRSGLARNALNRLQRMQNPGGIVPQAYGQRRPSGGGMHQGGGVVGPNGSPAPSPNGGPPGTGMPGPTAPPPIKVSPNGQLNLPWNAHNAMQAIAAQSLLNQRLQANQSQLDQYNLGYTNNIHNAEIQNDLAQKGILNNDADRGMAFSSGHAQNVSNQATQYNQFITDAMNQKNAFTADINNANTGASNTFLNKLRMMAINQGLDLEKYAGALGLDRSVAKGGNGTGGKHKPKPKPHNGGGGGNPKPKPKPRRLNDPGGIVPSVPRRRNRRRATDGGTRRSAGWNRL